MYISSQIWMSIARPTRYRKALSTLILACSFAPIPAHALGVLEPELKSHINEPLEVEIPLVLTPTEKNTDIVIQQIVGKYPNISDWIPELDFSLVSDSTGNFTIIASTLKPVNEPIVHFTVSIDTGSVWIQREMSFLLDPRPVQALATSRARSTKPKVILKPSQALQRQARRTPVEPVPYAPAASEDASTYIVKAGDSLSLIAQYISNNRDATMAQAMVSIFRANRKAFINNDVNKIKAHYEIVIPDESQMMQLSSAEARNIFYNLLASEERITPQTPLADVEVDRAPNVVQTDEEPPVQAEPVRPVADTPKQAIPPTTQPESTQSEQVKPIPAELTAPEAAEIAAKEQEIDFELRLATNDAGVPTKTINENEGTVVYEGQETAASKAASPSPEIKEAIRSVVDEMEDQLVTLREEVKNLRQSLQGRDNLLALKTETRLSSPPAEEPAALPVEEKQVPAAEQNNDGPIELDVSGTGVKEEGFDFLRLFLEILTLGAAGALVGYFIAFRRKRGNDDDSLTTSKYFRPTFTSDKSVPPPTPGAIQAASEVIPTEEPKLPKSTDDYIASSPRFNLDKKDSIEVTEEAYDDSLDFTHSEEETDAKVADTPPQQVTQTPPEREEAFNPEYVLQEANLSIAFKDFENAHHLLTKLTNNVPRNADYRIRMLGVLKELNKEDEFIYHANHLANITDKSFDTQWQQAYEIGQQFLPDHPLFSSQAPTSEAAASSPDNMAISDNVTPMNSPKTIVLDTRRALAEYEKKMREREALENSSDKNEIINQPEPVLNLDNLSNGDNNQQDHSFHLNIGEQPSSEENIEADEIEQSIDLPENLIELPGNPIDLPENNVAEQSLEYDETPVLDPAQAPVAATNTSDNENIIDFESSSDEMREQGVAEEISPEHLEELTSETLASMAEFSAIEGIPLDTGILKQLDKRKAEEDAKKKKDESDVD